MPGLPKRGNCVERRAGPKVEITPSVNQLLGMNVELDLADSAAPALEVESGTEGLALRIMVADALADRPDLLDRPEIERSPPDERLDRVEESVAEPPVAGAATGTDEGRSLPAERSGFVIGDRRVQRQDDGRDFG